MKIAQTVFLAGLLALSMACGYSKPATTPPTAGTMPTITELAPPNVTHGSQAFVLTVNGTDFSSTATIYWNGTAETTTVVSPGTQLTDHDPSNGRGYSGYGDRDGDQSWYRRRRVRRRHLGGNVGPDDVHHQLVARKV